MKAMASTNLSFIYFLEGDYNSADEYADLAVRNSRYNAKALVNKGNCLFVAQEYHRAKELYLEAIGVQADCVEAIYNLGLANMRMSSPDEARQAFEKLHTIIPNNPAVIYQIANLYEQQGKNQQAAKWFNVLITRVPTDPGILSRLGQIFSKEQVRVCEVRAKDGGLRADRSNTTLCGPPRRRRRARVSTTSSRATGTTPSTSTSSPGSACGSSSTRCTRRASTTSSARHRYSRTRSSGGSW